MRILVSSVGRDSHPTGICRVAANHVRAMLSNGVASSVVLAIGQWQRKVFRSMLGPHASSVEFIETDIINGSLQRNAWYAASLPRLARRYSADLVHLSYPAPTFQRHFRCPVVVTLHDLYPFDIPQNFGFPNYLGNRLILRQCLSAIDGIVCVSDTTRLRLEAIFPAVVRRVPVVVAGNYVYSPGGVPTPPAALTGLIHRGFLLTVAQHRKNKNLDVLLKAYAEFVKIGVCTGPLIIVGSEGPETSSLHALSESLGVGDRVKFTHSLSDNELSWLYANCALFIVSSSVEGYCLPVAEAQAAQARIVCSDIPTLRETAGAQCTYFSLSGDTVRSLVNAMTSALEQRDIETRRDVSSHDSVVVAQYSKLYTRLAPGC